MDQNYPQSENIESMWEAGKTVREIAMAVGLSHGVVNYHLVTRGLRQRAYRHNNIDPDVLREMAVTRRLSRNEIAKSFGVSPSTVTNAAKKYGVRLPKRWEYRGYPDKLSARQQEFIVGTLYGDGHIQVPAGTSDTAQFYAHHGPEQIEYLEWKRKLMADFLTEAYHESPVADPTGFHFVTVCHPVFLEWRHRAYALDRTKRYADLVPLLTPFALAIWYMDDGTFSPRDGNGVLTTRLHPTEATILQEAMLSNFRVETTTPWAGGTRKTKKMLNIRVRSWPRFGDLVGPHLHPSMLYKVG